MSDPAVAEAEAPTGQQAIDSAYAELDAIRLPLRAARADVDRMHKRRVELYLLLDSLGEPSTKIGKHIDEGAGSVRVALGKAKDEAARTSVAVVE